MLQGVKSGDYMRVEEMLETSDWWLRVVRTAVWGPLVALAMLFATKSEALYWSIMVVVFTVFAVGQWRARTLHSRGMSAINALPPAEALEILERAIGRKR